MFFSLLTRNIAVRRIDRKLIYNPPEQVLKPNKDIEIIEVGEEFLKLTLKRPPIYGEFVKKS